MSERKLRIYTDQFGCIHIACGETSHYYTAKEILDSVEESNKELADFLTFMEDAR